MPCTNCGGPRNIKQVYCSVCNAARWKAHYYANVEASRARVRAWFKTPAGREARRKWHRDNPVKSQVHLRNAKSRRRGATGRLTAQEWLEIVARQQGRCNHCNTKCKLTIDHIVAVEHGGPNVASNIQGLCHRCNSLKANNDWETWHAANPVAA